MSIFATRLLGFLLLLTLAPHAALLADDASTVKLTEADDTVEVTINGKPFTTFHSSDELPKPYFHPMLTAAGHNITRDLVPLGVDRKEAKKMGMDHPHHRGLWVAVEKVNGLDHWHEASTIRNVSTKVVKAEGNPVILETENHWLDDQKQPVLKETTTVRIYADRLITYDIDLEAVSGSVEFQDTKEGFFSFRMADKLRAKNDTGVITNADGATEEKGCWGIPSNWVDYSGQLDGDTVGAAIFDHPDNFRPARYHVRAYGLFTASPFGESAYTNGKLKADPVRLQPGKDLHLKYAIYVHDGDLTAADVAGRYQSYLTSSED
ncbi:DUF6807 domain-containing protein [Calycomorphotria hydatis]|uniref:Methane oxygenase PmoA n=1 Tax=Calycomorphotria hydatis TaxID=2528027 RepID=A0A517T493_9PLAN|nr:PmoA family protein [Calycomorphotria hydatis]QDT63203.1 hypothetical protein V22_04210 [Calycomorphotria hydatis]